MPTPQGSGDSKLSGVACDSTGQICTTTGYYSNGNHAPLTYLSSNGGKTWITSLPPFQGSGDSELAGVTCDNTGQMCIIVGDYNSNTAPLSYYSNNGGKNWIVSFPQSQGSAGDLFGVTCDSTGQICTAVGFYSNAGTFTPLSYYSNNGGKSWTVSFPQPQGSGDSALLGVA